MGDIDDALDAIRTALDPQRFFEQLSESERGRSFLSGETDSVTLTRSFLDREAEIAQQALAALEEIRRHLAGS